MPEQVADPEVHQMPLDAAPKASGPAAGERSVSAIAQYRDVYLGQPGLWRLLRYEFAVVAAMPMPGALGLAMRSALYPRLLRRCGRKVRFGRNVLIRCPGRIEIGDRCTFDDECMIDGRGGGDDAIRIGSNVLCARAVILQVKVGYLHIGNHCTIGAACFIGSAGGIRLGNAVMIAGHCYIGGGRYATDKTDAPMIEQESYSLGPVEIGDNVWIGAGVTILDGVRIGSGCVIGAGATVRENVPDNTVLTPHQRHVMLPRTSPAPR